LRFFTRRSARRMLRDNGFEIVAEEMSVMPVELALGLPAENPLMRFLNSILWALTKLSPGLFGYQILFSARRRAEFKVAAPSSSETIPA
jgi:hypothetical protein